MANDHGHLPKRSELTPDQQQHLDRWWEKAYTDDNLFRTLAGNERVLEMFLGWAAEMYSSRSGIDRHMVELCRIRMANRNECFH